ncbi:MAG: PBP1A family penicillin-binding protein [Thermodesulfobacteriota bacterium]|nr:PBP1A family penicillin-binding protein [Thermodesulfobacteriota bacterium]
MTTIYKIFRYLILLTIVGAVVTLSALAGAYFYVASSLPKFDSLEDYQPPTITRVYSEDGQTIAEFYHERRIVVPVERMPQQLIQAFVAAEDANFFEHQGIDLVSIFRAALKNLKAGGIVQGGSTITQQVAKSLLLTPERKFSRKFKEAILAWRMEQRFAKREILYLYLNQIYLGHGAYGVQAASENYFDKNVEDLTLAECSIIAGLPQAPSRYSPYRHYQRAKDRQLYVLRRMLANGYIDDTQAKNAYAAALTIHPRGDNSAAGTGYFSEQVRRSLVQEYGKERLYNSGLQVHTTMNLTMQQAAQQAVRQNLHNHDKRQGYRGVVRQLSEQETIVAIQTQEEELVKSPLKVGQVVEAVLTGATDSHLNIQIGSFTTTLTRKKIAWAGPFQVVAATAEPIIQDKSRRGTKLSIGSVLLVKVINLADQQPTVDLFQQPLAQGALLAMDPHTGYVKAMVGGYDFATSQFNRVLQSQRLPGSAIKPLIYSAAMDKGYTAASVILDTPLIFKETTAEGKKREWKPKNYGNKFSGPTSLRTALTHSRNIITIKLLNKIGIGYTARYLKKLGISSPLNRDLTMALGSGAITPMELATAYSVFASGGVKTTANYITRITDRNGRILQSVDPADFPFGLADDQKLIRLQRQRVISQETACLITNMLESVVQRGTGWRAKALKRPNAAKTGTTNNLKDAWFAGYIPQLVTVSWVGYDHERYLGKNETGSKAAAPAWVAFMRNVIAKFPVKQFNIPDSMEFHPIDPETGLLAPEDSTTAHIEMFCPGTTPTHYALDENKLKARDFFLLD